MKLATQSKSWCSRFNLQLILFFAFLNTFSQTYDPDDLPPEFGLGDDPEPGASIDFLIPWAVALMMIVLLRYYRKTMVLQNQAKDHSKTVE